MSQRATTILTCDFCGKEGDDVKTETLTLNGKTTEAEACPKCWTKVGRGVTEFVTKGRHVPRRRRARTPSTAGV